MLALRRSSTIAAATRQPCFVPYLRRFSTETSQPKEWYEILDTPSPRLNDDPPTENQPSPKPNYLLTGNQPPPRHKKDDPPKGNQYDRVLLPGSKLDIPEYRLHCKSTNNNTIVTFTNTSGQTIAWQSGGRCEFKGANRASFEAGYQSAVRVFQVIERLADEKDFKVALFLKGFGQGREALKTALLAVEGQNIRSLVCSVTDRTPIKIGGTRSKKTRRL